MTWEYRVHKYQIGTEYFYRIVEVYYNSKGEPMFRSEGGCDPAGETREELSSDVVLMSMAFNKPDFVDPETWGDQDEDDVRI